MVVVSKELLDSLKKSRASSVLDTIKSDLFSDRPAFLELKDKKDLVGVELGVQYGVNAANILQYLNIKKLYLVDIHDTAERREILKDFEHKIVYIIKSSTDAVTEIPDDLDFVYIDADHTEKAVYEDIENYFPKVREGGLVAGHDYNRSGTRASINKFFDNNKRRVSTLKRDWWVIK
uniref:Putative methyltransferase n=1 Tax=viral metagenome TaxID=1070528 RepID=A0A6H1ZJF0_9ZZZZ